MKIYISHSTGFDFKTDLYSPIQNSDLVKENEYIFPHESSLEPMMLKEMFKNKSVDLIIAEVSYPSTGQGIELGNASFYNIPIFCIYKTGSKYSTALKSITDKFVEYKDQDDIVEKLRENISN